LDRADLLELEAVIWVFPDVLCSSILGIWHPPKAQVPPHRTHGQKGKPRLPLFRRRVRRHGQFLQQLDELEGNRLDEIETRLFEKIDTLQARIHKVENEVRKLSDGQHRHRGDQLTTSKKKEGTVAANYSYSGSGF
jgi:hypothetical protein